METKPLDALFYDGLSSSPQNVNWTLHVQQGLLYIQFPDQQIHTWQLKELDYAEAPSFLDLRLKNNPAAYLSIPNSVAAELLKVLRNTNLHGRFRSMSPVKVFLVVLLLLGALVGSYFLLVPILAEKAVVFIPQSVDNQIGETAFQAMVSPDDIDSAKTIALNAFAQQLQLENQHPIHFNVVNSSEINAFALPNGEVVVYTGILRKMDQSSQLTALIGHEVSHVNARHSMRLLSRNLAGYVIISLLVGDIGGFTTILVDNAQQLHQLAFSRKHEEEADHLGLQIMLKNHQDPNGMLQLFSKLQKHAPTDIPEMLSTHPLPKSRIQKLSNELKSIKIQPRQNPKLEYYFKQLKN
ncbi:MAG: hypothetical protein RLZZ65_1196 [Bacteroidota bacterium]|jgi:Zn-dependent protease with chaperone function